MALQDERLTRLLLETHTIVMVGASLRPDRASHRVGNYLVEQGYRVVPVNPGHSGEDLFGERIVGSLKEVEGPVDMLNIFRRSEFIAPIVREGLAELSGLKSIWMQLDLKSAEGRAVAEAKGLTVIEDRCLAIEHRRLLGGR